MNKNSSVMKTRTSSNVLRRTGVLTKVSLLSVIAYIIMFAEFPLFFLPPFLKIDLSDIPAIVGAFALGPGAGVIIELVKNILHGLTASSTGGVGDIANFIVGSAFVIPAAVIYKRKKSKKTAVVGLLVGTIVMTILAGILNYYLLIPFYSKFMPIETIIEMSSAANSAITDMKSLIIYGVVPFNIVKGVMLTILSVIIYKKISPLLH